MAGLRLGSATGISSEQSGMQYALNIESPSESPTRYTLDDAMLLYMLRSQYVVEPAFRWEIPRRYAVIDDTERRACCEAYTSSRRAPYRLVDHCRSIEHIAQLYEVDETQLRRMQRQKPWRVVKKLCGQTYMSEFGLRRGELVSVSESAPRLVQLLQKKVCHYTDEELTIFSDWIKQYYPTAALIDWSAVRAMYALQQSG